MKPAAVDLRADCARCLGLCCVALAFAKSSDFAADKAMGEPCGNLTPELRCGIHADLRGSGYSGCVSYDCFGAGQRLCAGASDWRAHPDQAGALFAALPVMRQLHELLWYLDEALALPDVANHHVELDAARARVVALTNTPALLDVDLDAARASVNPLLLSVSSTYREGLRGPSRRGADLVGAVLGRADLRGADLRGALLIAAQLNGADLRRADLIGADLRDADLAGADLSDALFVTQGQVNSARGDARTKLSARLLRPAHWS